MPKNYVASLASLINGLECFDRAIARCLREQIELGPIGRDQGFNMLGCQLTWSADRSRYKCWLDSLIGLLLLLKLIHRICDGGMYQGTALGTETIKAK